MTDIHVSADGYLSAGPHRFRCALGRAGLSEAKREGDGATPTGCYALRRVLYRADRVAAPETALTVQPIGPDDGWCDDPAYAEYNRPVSLPFEGSCERMWREDHLYDLVVVLGHNDDPPVAYAGSAIFLHLAKPDYAPTEGCVALALPDMLRVLRDAGADARLCVG